jgi:vanillate O-demethylase monooxygenase subunit
VIEAQWQNQKRFGFAPQVAIHVDVGPNRVRRIIDKLVQPAMPKSDHLRSTVQER